MDAWLLALLLLAWIVVGIAAAFIVGKAVDKIFQSPVIIFHRERRHLRAFPRT